MRVLKSIEVVKVIQLKGPSGGYVGTILDHEGSSGHRLECLDDGSVIITHPQSPWQKVIPPGAIVAYEWHVSEDAKPLAKAK